MHFYYIKPIFLCIQSSNPFRVSPENVFKSVWIQMYVSLLTYSVILAARCMWVECICSLCICMLLISITHACELSNAAWYYGWKTPDVASKWYSAGCPSKSVGHREIQYVWYVFKKMCCVGLNPPSGRLCNSLGFALTPLSDSRGR